MIPGYDPEMLERLEVRGLGIIDRVELELGGGFVALTGETGAGKSLLVESLKLLSGQRAQVDMVRSGDDRLRVEACFALDDQPTLVEVLDELGIPGDGSLVLRREVSEAGRSRCWANDVSVTAGALQRIALHLLAIHGQHEQHGLANPVVQRRLVDDFGRYGELLDAVRAAYEVWRETAAELDRLESARQSRRDRLDVISVQQGEIDGVDPQPGEDEALLQRRQLLRHAVRLLELSTASLDRLVDSDSSAVDALAQAERDLREMLEFGLELEGAVERLAEARVHAEEVARELRDRLGGVQEDPGELETVESRLHRLEQLMLKYGSSVEEVLEHRDRLRAEREELDEVEDRLDAASVEAGRALATYDDAAAALEEARREAAASLVGEVGEVLGHLNMGGTTLEFAWQPRGDDSSPLRRGGASVAFDEEGVEQCELLIAANPGETPRPMARIASGGELSRLHLALRTVLLGRRAGSSLTLLFDEVDSGLGGATAAALGDLLADLAADYQVLVVTHLPQVAARAEGHYKVEKVPHEGRAVTRTQRLEREEREAELARMLAGGELTASALEHARTLLGER
jgi:DNA repair protein RecN (Recombination protein N)